MEPASSSNSSTECSNSLSPRWDSRSSALRPRCPKPSTSTSSSSLVKAILPGAGGDVFLDVGHKEVLEMIRWMRKYNSDPRHEKKVKFYGFDAQIPSCAPPGCAVFLAKVDAELPPGTKEVLSTLANPFLATSFDPLVLAKNQAASNAVRAVVEILDRQKTEYIERTSAEEWAVARQHARVLSHALAIKNPKDMQAGSRERDRAMADNIRWILEHEGPGTKMAVWAHNGHVATLASGGFEWMGHHLRQMYGPEMVVFGFAFNQGSFQAVELPVGTGKLRPFRVKPAPEGSLDAMLAASGLAMAAIDLRALPKDGPVAAWFDQPRSTRSIGAIYSEQSGDRFFSETTRISDLRCRPLRRNYNLRCARMQPVSVPASES